MSFQKFEPRAPSAQTAVDVFAGKWASDLSRVMAVANSGGADLFVSDPRPKWAAEAFGKGTGRLDGMRVLELGPLEGGHSYQLEKLGAAAVVAIDTNTEAYLKCLIVKEVLGLTRCEFRLGDALEYMKTTADRYDVVFCSGLLYHMKNPIELIKACCDVGNRCFVWSHYYNEASGNNGGQRMPRHVTEDGFETTYHELESQDQGAGTDLGGHEGAGGWMGQEEIFACFRHFGLDEIQVFEDAPLHPNGAAMSFAASRRWAETFVRVTAPPKHR